MKCQPILDTGPLVAYLNKADRYHQWAIDVFSEYNPPLITCESVMAEAFYLLRNITKAHEALFKMVERGVIKIEFSFFDEMSQIRRLMLRYKDQPMDLADGCIVRMSELNPDSLVITLDSDFEVYRRNGRQAIPLVKPQG